LTGRGYRKRETEDSYKRYRDRQTDSHKKYDSTPVIKKHYNTKDYARREIEKISHEIEDEVKRDYPNVEYHPKTEVVEEIEELEPIEEIEELPDEEIEKTLGEFETNWNNMPEQDISEIESELADESIEPDLESMPEEELINEVINEFEAENKVESDEEEIEIEPLDEIEKRKKEELEEPVENE